MAAENSRLMRLSKRSSMTEVVLKEEFIKLGQALKAANLVENGGEAKRLIQEGHVKVNGEVELQRGKKLFDGDSITFRGETVRITARKE